MNGLKIEDVPETPTDDDTQEALRVLHDEPLLSDFLYSSAIGWALTMPTCSGCSFCLSFGR